MFCCVRSERDNYLRKGESRWTTVQVATAVSVTRGGRKWVGGYHKGIPRRADFLSERLCEQYSCGEEENLERLFIKEERRIMVHRALKKLKPEYHQVLWLIYFENFSNKEAEAVMKKSVHNIETLVYRARKSLRSQLEMEGFEYEEL